MRQRPRSLGLTLECCRSAAMSIIVINVFVMHSKNHSITDLQVSAIVTHVDTHNPQQKPKMFYYTSCTRYRQPNTIVPHLKEAIS